MGPDLESILGEMSLEDDEPLILEDEPQFRSTERNKISLLGRLLNPKRQSMRSMIFDFPRKWGLYERAKGIALSNETFQFVFKHAEDMDTVLRKGVWTQDDWCVTLEKWVEDPPPDYLNFLSIWVRIRNIPVNFYTTETIGRIAGTLGTVLEIAYDPERPQSQGYVRARVRFDTSKPLRSSKLVQFPNGAKVEITFDYERIRHKCQTCLRLTHDKADCLLHRDPPGSSQNISSTTKSSNSAESQNHIIPVDDSLAGVIRDEDLRTKGSTREPLVTKDKLHQLRQYLSTEDESEKSVRKERLRQHYNDLREAEISRQNEENLVNVPVISSNLHKDKGIVFTFDTHEESSSQGRKLMQAALYAGYEANKSNHNPESITRNSETAFLPTDSTGFRIGTSEASSSGISGKKGRTRGRPPSWKRKPRTNIPACSPQTAEDILSSDSVRSKEKNKTLVQQQGTPTKRKATNIGEISPNSNKRNQSRVGPTDPPIIQ